MHGARRRSDRDCRYFCGILSESFGKSQTPKTRPSFADGLEAERVGSRLRSASTRPQLAYRFKKKLEER
jgi:hypothetical protein